MDEETQKTPRKQLAKHESKYCGSEKLDLQFHKIFYFYLCFEMEIT
jgi:hypothetical protein